MKRKKFITTMFTAAATVPLAAFTQNKKSTAREGKGFKIDNSKDRFGKSISLFEGDTFSTKVSTKDTDGDIYMFESTRIKKGGPPLHYHTDQDEWWYVLSGEFIVKIGDDTYTAKAGDSVFGPRSVPHAFAKTNEGEGKLLMFFQPAGKMEEWFQLVSKGTYRHLSKEELNAKRKEYGFVVIGPALTYEKK